MVRITAKLLEAGRSTAGGWSRAQAEALGIAWPLTAGWKRGAVGRLVTEEAMRRFIDLRDKHRRAPPAEQRSIDFSYGDTCSDFTVPPWE